MLKEKISDKFAQISQWVPNEYPTTKFKERSYWVFDLWLVWEAKRSGWKEQAIYMDYENKDYAIFRMTSLEIYCFKCA